MFGWVTLCCGCNQVINPVWILTGAQRTRMQEGGMDRKTLVEANNVLCRELEDMQENAPCTRA